MPLDPAKVDASYQSVDAEKGAIITFNNQLNVPVDVYWISYSGERVFYQRLRAGASYIQPTFMTHPWLIVQAGTGGTTARGSGTLITAFLPATPDPADAAAGDTANIVSFGKE